MARINRSRPTTRRRRRLKIKKALMWLLIVFIVLMIIFAVLIGTSHMGRYLNRQIMKIYGPVVKDDMLVPVLEDGVYTFTTDREMKVMQITDIHMGAGFFTIQKDRWAITAVSTMISIEKPDLVIITGDLAHPVGLQTGSFDNLTQLKMVAEMMENLGVYWTFVFGNHEALEPCFYTLKELADYISAADLKYCLFDRGPQNISGEGNHYINVKNSNGIITHSFIMLDSHAYAEGGYDNIKPDQIEWYEGVINQISEYNLTKHLEEGGLQADFKKPNSLMFFHIPLKEYEDAWYAYYLNEEKHYVKYIYGEAKGPRKPVNYGVAEDDVFETALRLGSTTGMFVGHDHLNNFQIEYKGIRLTYGYSIDYTAFVGIHKKGAQRGCTLIYAKTDGTWNSELSNYYQTKYDSINRTEVVSMN